jgi:hypothetical protein
MIERVRRMLVFPLPPGNSISTGGGSASVRWMASTINSGTGPHTTSGQKQSAKRFFDDEKI